MIEALGRALAGSVGLMALATLPACSFTTTKYQTCEANLECQDAFGWGHTCGEDGLCQVVEKHPRCQNTLPEDLFENREAYADHILMGVNFDLLQSPLEAKATALVINQANEAGGLDGQEYAIVECTSQEGSEFDNLSIEEANKEVTRYLVEDLGVVAIMGPDTSGSTADAYIIASEHDVVSISPSATSPALTSLDGLTCSYENPGLLWRTAPPDDLQGQVMAQDIIDRGVKKVAVIFQ